MGTGVIAMLTAVKECRLTPRETLSEPVRVRPCDLLFAEEICTTANVSRTGLYFVTSTSHYFVGMNVIVTLNFGPDDPIHRERIGDVVRVDDLDEGKRGIAIRILMNGNPGIYSGT
jgi:hypothetical protein